VNRIMIAVGLTCCISAAAKAQIVDPQQQTVGSSSALAGATNTTNASSSSRSTGGTAIAAPRSFATGGRATGGNASVGSSTSHTGSSNATAGASTSSVNLNYYTGGASGSSPDSGGSPGSSGGGDPTIRYGGSYTVHNTPDVAAPALFGGTNPCSVGVSAGVGVAGFGLSAGSTWSDRGCERRNSAVILFQANMPDVAVALLCQDHDIRSAFGNAGKPCPQDRVARVSQVVAPAGPITASVQPVPQFRPTTTIAARPLPVWRRPDWCDTVSSQDVEARPNIRIQCRMARQQASAN
jgi:hypothetical protein